MVPNLKKPMNPDDATGQPSLSVLAKARFTQGAIGDHRRVATSRCLHPGKPGGERSKAEMPLG